MSTPAPHLPSVFLHLVRNLGQILQMRSALHWCFTYLICQCNAMLSYSFVSLSLGSVLLPRISSPSPPGLFSLKKRFLLRRCRSLRRRFPILFNLLRKFVCMWNRGKSKNSLKQPYNFSRKYAGLKLCLYVAWSAVTQERSPLEVIPA